MAFHVGQKVVCVDAGPRTWQRCHLRRGAVYTVKEVVAWRGRYGLHLHELESQSGLGFFSDRFRPLIDRKSSISFTTGAPKDSETWDNRRKVKERV